MAGAGYDLSTSTFSPDGRCFQVEYAMKAAEKSGLAIGIRCKDGVVLGVEKPLTHRLLLPRSNRRIHTVDHHVGMAMTGIAGDADKLANVGREEAHNYEEFYGIEIPGSVLNKRLAAQVHTYTIYWYLRPFGASALLATFDEQHGPELYVIEPVGTGFRYSAAAIGKNKASAKTELEKIKFNEITSREAVDLIANIIYKLHDDVKDKDFELELSWVTQETGRKHVFVPEELRSNAIAKAQAAKQKEEMDESEDEAEQ